MKTLYKRTIFGLVFIFVMLAGLLVHKYLFAALVSFMMAGMMYEFLKMATSGRKKGLVAAVIVSAVAQFLLVFACFAEGLSMRFLPLALLPPFIVVFCSVLCKSGSERQDDYAYMLAGFVYIALPLLLYNVLAFRGIGFDGRLILAFFIMIWCSDVGAYCAGSALGKKLHSKKLSPHISPNKTWVGFWGGLLFCMIAAYCLHVFGMFRGISLPHCLALAAIVHAGGVCGDLFESLWKRHFDVKDSGNIIPGHGGLLDRFDSSLVAIPLASVYLYITELI